MTEKNDFDYEIDVEKDFDIDVDVDVNLDFYADVDFTKYVDIDVEIDVHPSISGNTALVEFDVQAFEDSLYLEVETMANIAFSAASLVAEYDCSDVKLSASAFGGDTLKDNHGRDGTRMIVWHTPLSRFPCRHQQFVEISANNQSAMVVVGCLFDITCHILHMHL